MAQKSKRTGSSRLPTRGSSYASFTRRLMADRVLEPIHAGHHYVQEQQIRLTDLKFLKCLTPVMKALGVVAQLGEELGQASTGHLRIVHDHHSSSIRHLVSLRT